MIVPRLTAEKQLHETHAALDQPPRDQAARAVLGRLRIVEAVQMLWWLRFRPEMSSASLAADCIRAASS